jgi:hypothetical protein
MDWLLMKMDQIMAQCCLAYSGAIGVRFSGGEGNGQKRWKNHAFVHPFFRVVQMVF